MTKMYQDLKETFWWQSMKKNVAQFVSACFCLFLSVFVLSHSYRLILVPIVPYSY